MSDPLLKLLQTALFGPEKRHRLSLREYMDLNIDRMRAIIGNGLMTNDMWLGQSRQSEFRLMLERAAYIGAWDYSLIACIVDHFIAGDAFFAHGSQHQIAKYHKEICQLQAVYGFGCTEIASGSDVGNLQTTITHDPHNHCLILNSPTAQSCKFWIGNTLHAAVVVMVLGRLIVKGVDEGLHWFRVRIREEENGPLLPGVRITTCDPKGGIHANQVAGIRFCKMKLPMDALMQRYARFSAQGDFSSDIPPKERSKSAMQTFIQERLFLIAAARGGASMCVYLTYRFGSHRLLKDNEGSQPLLTKALFRQRLYVEQLKVLALEMLERAVLSRLEGSWHQAASRTELHILAAIVKSVGTWLGLEVMRACRELCGSQGFHHRNQIVTLCIDHEISSTFAGDNNVLCCQVAKAAISRPRFACENIAQRIESLIVDQCRSTGGFSHRQAVALTYARALDLIIDEGERHPLVSSETLRDIVHVFSSKLYQWGLTAAGDELERNACEDQLRVMNNLLKPPPELVSAPIDSADYVKCFTKPLYDNEPDFSNRNTIRNPYRAYAWLREHQPVYWCEHLQAWFLTRYRDVIAAQADSRRFSSNRMQQLIDARVPENKRTHLTEFIKLASRWMYSQDGAVHKASRQLLGNAFTPRSIESLRKIIQDITDRELSRLHGQTDLKTALFDRIPALILASLYGLEDDEALKLRRWTRDIVMFLGGSQDADQGPDQALEGVKEMYAFFAELIEQRRRQPRDDLVSRVLESGRNSAASLDEVLAQIVFILVAGYTTSADQLCLGLLHLLKHPQQLEALLADPTLIGSFIEEMLRFDPAGSLSHRVLMEDVTIDNVTMKKGDLVYLIRASANRDPEQFPAPDKFDIHRARNEHLTFGKGEHFCMGTSLFRLEAEIVFISLLKRFPDLHLIARRPATWRNSNLQFRGLETLPVDLGTGV
ncbi:cytochrome P450 [Pseudomonas fitomaticsae]